MADETEMTGAEIRRRLKSLAPSGLAETNWAVEAGVNRGFFTNLASVRSPRMESIRKLLAYIGKTEADLYGVVPPGNASPPIRYEGATDYRMSRDLPIYGSAIGAEQIVEGEAVELTTLNRGEIVEYRERPPILNGKPDVYGLYVQGSSMDPAFDDGDLLVVQKTTAISAGDFIVLYLRPKDETDDGERASNVLVKRLVRRTAKYWELRQYQPDVIFRIAVEDVLRADRALRTRDLLS